VIAARWPRDDTAQEKLMVVDPGSGRFEARRVNDLPGLLRAGDLLVVNDAATLPASLRGVTLQGEPIEARLLALHGEGASRWRAVLFGAGDWRTRTEDRRPPPRLAAGDRLRFDGGLVAHVERVGASSERLVELRFDADEDQFWSLLYRHGRPVQYAHVAAPLALWHVQTVFGARPWASEMPSAARPLAWELILALRGQGIGFARVTHAAGLSATGDARLDAALPLRESFAVPAETVEAIGRARAQAARVVAVGTSVVRALEPVTNEDGTPRAATGETDLLVDGSRPLRVVDAILTGMHEPGTSHDALLHAFAPDALLRTAHAAAEASGFLGHEFGDSMLLLRGALPAPEGRAAW
jgi:S-adenosylmethionine:tRNA ribosyltransferase-isomerase